MSRLADQHFIVGITGGIAAYKSAELVRRLCKQGAEVQVIMTQAAKAFIAPLTLQALSGRPVRDTLLDPEAESGMGHIELGRWADTIVIAPASADFIARLAAGLASDLLSTVCLATSAPVILAPAMNQAMWQKPTTQRNLATLRADGITLLEQFPEPGTFGEHSGHGYGRPHLGGT
jgi:phosphopantothenoylcysteine decarboxylase/phosphopantothenate--cysteine ligase